MKDILNDHEKTLLMPLFSRALESKKANPIFKDYMAAEIVEKSGMELQGQNLSAYSALTLSVRARQFYRYIEKSIAERPSLTIVNLGSGLDTTFYSVDNGTMTWFNIDSKKVNALRNSLMPQNQRVVNIDGNVLDRTIFETITPKTNCLFMASGLFIYFSESQIRELLLFLSGTFPGSTIVFDWVSNSSLRYIRNDLLSNGLNGSIIQWGIDDLREMESWEKGFSVSFEIPMFQGIDRTLAGDSQIRRLMDLNDQYWVSGLAALCL